MFLAFTNCENQISSVHQPKVHGIKPHYRIIKRQTSTDEMIYPVGARVLTGATKIHIVVRV